MAGRGDSPRLAGPSVLLFRVLGCGPITSLTAGGDVRRAHVRVCCVFFLAVATGRRDQAPGEQGRQDPYAYRSGHAFLATFGGRKWTRRPERDGGSEFVRRS